MTRTVTDAQVDNLVLTRTRPVIIVKWEHSGTEELFSCSGGNVIYDSETYTAGTLSLKSLRDNSAAVLTMAATDTRIDEVVNNSWRQGACCIWLIPAVITDTQDTEYSTTDAVLMLDGLITHSRWGGGNSITVKAIHKDLDGNYTPRNTCDEFTSHLNPAGSILSWEGEKLVLEPPR